jgi:hypothetical protein
MRVLEEATMREAPSMNAQGVGNTLWALATLGWQPANGARSLLEGVALQLARSMNSQNVANTLWAFATLGWQVEGPLRSALESAAIRVAGTMSTLDVASILWALATLNGSVEGLWQTNSDMADRLNAVVKSVIEAAQRRESDLPELALSQLLQAHLASEFLGLSLVTLPSGILEMSLEVVRAQVRETASLTASGTQRDIGEALGRLGIAHEREHLTPDGLFSIDLAILDRRIAIEYGGPSHFTTNTLEPLGLSRLRHRLLSAMGWHVVSVPFFEWDVLRKPEQKDAYVERRLLRS